MRLVASGALYARLYTAGLGAISTLGKVDVVAKLSSFPGLRYTHKCDDLIN